MSSTVIPEVASEGSFTYALDSWAASFLCSLSWRLSAKPQECSLSDKLLPAPELQVKFHHHVHLYRPASDTGKSVILLLMLVLLSLAPSAAASAPMSDP